MKKQAGKGLLVQCTPAAWGKQKRRYTGLNRITITFTATVAFCTWILSGVGSLLADGHVDEKLIYLKQHWRCSAEKEKALEGFFACITIGKVFRSSQITNILLFKL